MSATNATNATTHPFQAEVSQVLSLVINSLYSNKEIFLRELISNAADALDKLRFTALQKPELLPEGHALRIRLIPDEKQKTLTLWDNGIGMSEAELRDNLGTVARSGSKDFMTKLREAQQAQEAQKGQKDKDAQLSLIGQFGVGFYSGYLVADRIEVVSRAAGSDTAFRWSSEGKDTFSIEPAERESIGTSVILHLKKEAKEFLEPHRLRELVTRYSDYVSHTIELQEKGDKKDDAPKIEAINQASALWMRRPKEITEEQYVDFYKHFTHDWEAPIARTHFSVEGSQSFTALLFIPKRPPFDLFSPDSRHGVRLHVKRVFIMDDCNELLPRWLRFVRGVVDTDDLPLNVSRELLQDSAAVKTIRKQVIKKVLDLLIKVAKDQPDDYAQMWSKFGGVIKEGLHFDPDQKEKLAKLVRYECTQADGTTREGLTSLADYVARMPEGQTSIYYAVGASRAMLAASPHLEGLRKRGYEVLLMTDPVDQWAVAGLAEFEGKSLVSAMDEDLQLDAAKTDEQKAEEKADRSNLDALLERFKRVLSERVSEVRASDRLIDSPVCLVTPKGGLPAHIERLLRATQTDTPMPEQKRILEINPDHALIQRLATIDKTAGHDPKLDEWIELLFDQALLTEGSPLTDPARFASRMTGLLVSATAAS